MATDFTNMSLSELKDEAKKRGLKNISIFRKQQLIDLLASEGREEKRQASEAEYMPEITPEESRVPETKAEHRTEENRVAEPRTDRYMARPAAENRGSAAQAPVRRPYGGQPEGRPAGTRPLYQGQAQNTAGQSVQPSAQGAVPQRPAMNERVIDYYAGLSKEAEALDSGETKEGILEIMPDGFGFIRCDNYLPGEHDVYVSPMQIRRFGLRTGDIICGNTKIRTQTEKFSALLYIKTINGVTPMEAAKRTKFENLTPIFPNERIHLETPGCSLAMRMVDLISPIGKGQRGMIVSQPKTGKTTLLKQVAKSITKNHKDMHLIILLIDERPEEVTDIKESIEGEQVEVIYSTFDELPENHKRVSEMVIERAKRLVEHKKDVVILLDSITRLARAYNLTVQASGRTLSGGLDPAALHMPKKFFGAARNMREGGSLTILATALVETGSRMDDVVFEEFKGTGNMELVLDRNLSERRVFPAIDLPRSSTRREDLLLSPSELEASTLMRRALNGLKCEEATERIISMFSQTKNNAEFIEMVKKTKIVN
ncbi:MAG: transcription termination factor Rho [Lachnospiraceae bacterium]